MRVGGVDGKMIDHHCNECKLYSALFAHLIIFPFPLSLNGEFRIKLLMIDLYLKYQSQHVNALKLFHILVFSFKLIGIIE